MSAHLDREKTRAWLIEQFGLPDLPDEIGDDELDKLDSFIVIDHRAVMAAIRKEIANAFNYPKPLDSMVLGRDVSKLANAVTAGVLEALQ